MNNLQEFFKNKKILITGHTGFKGSWLGQILLNWRANVTGIALKPSVSPNLFNLLNIKKKINNYFADIRNFKKIKEIIFKEKPEIVFHLAAQPLVRDSYDDPLYTFETNIIGTANVLQAIKEVGGVKSAVIITTDKVYEEKEKDYCYRENDKLKGYDPYSASKAGAEMVIDSYIKSFFNPKNYQKKHNTLVVSVRSGNVIGGGDWQRDRLMPDIIKAIFEKRKLIMRNPESIRPWQYVLEPLYGYLILAKKLYEGEKEICGAWNFGPEEKNYLTVKKLVKKTLKMLKRRSYIIKRDTTKHEADFLKLDISKAKKILGWRPIFDLDQTLKLTLDWYKSFYNKENVIGITNQQIKLFFNEI
ncbi:MAG: CDP-glucose 4,6-dehydratase [Flavobacterium sp.]|nr:CDP-glucose 4,6-dehydratase [Flavobacterium sp.]